MIEVPKQAIHTRSKAAIYTFNSGVTLVPVPTLVERASKKLQVHATMQQLTAAAAAGDHAHRLTDVVWNCSMLQKKPA
jgi:hypothetical protein